MATDTSKITGAANELSDGLAKGGTAAKTLGAEIANAFNSLDARVAALEGAAPVPPDNTHGEVTNFAAVNGGQFNVGGVSVKNDNANKSWSITNPDKYTVRIEVRSHDCWVSTDGKWNDATMNNGAERSEISWSPQYGPGAPATMYYSLNVESGSPNNAAWLVFTQVHTTSGEGRPPFAIELAERVDQMQVKVRFMQNGQVTEKILFKDTANIERGRVYQIKAQVKFDSGGNGFAKVWRDGTQIADYAGKVGYDTTAKYYFKNGIYRDPAQDPMAMRFSNMYFTTP